MSTTGQQSIESAIEGAEGRAIERAFRAHLSPAFHRLVRRAAGLDGDSQEGNPTDSLATCEKVPTSDEARAENHPEEYELVTHSSDAREALMVSISRSRDRQRKVLGLIQGGEVAHAKRLATCGRKSVELTCGGWDGCGATNYVPVTCDSPLCPDCSKKKQGRKIGQYKERVRSWDHPTMMRLSLGQRVDPTDLERAVDALRGAHGRLRRRVVPPNGSHRSEDGELKRWAWSVGDDGGQPADHYWKPALIRAGRRDLAARWERKYVSEGRGIPFEEIVPEGFYGIDMKQGENGQVNVHMHVLAEIPYLPQAALASVWDDLTDAPVVDIRRIEERGSMDRTDALLETIGYAAKAPEWESVEDEVEYYKTMKGSKLVQPFGDLHGNTPDADEKLYCHRCERSPAELWNVEWVYEGVVDGHYSTAVVGGPDGDRPPPGEGHEV